MRPVLALVFGLFLGVNFFLPAARRIAPVWFPTETRGKIDSHASTSEIADAPQLPLINAPETIHAFVTAYDPYDEECVGKHAYEWPRLTATGSNAEEGGIAADLAVIPPGSRIEIPELGTFTVDDTGGAMRNDARRTDHPFYHLDIRIPASYGIRGDEEEARRQAHIHAKAQGAHWMDVRVIPPGTFE